MPLIRNSEKKGQSATVSKKGGKKTDIGNQSKMDTFLDTKETEKAEGEFSTSIAATHCQTDDATVPLDIESLENVGNVEITDISSIQGVLNKILNAVKPIASMNTKLNGLVIEVSNIKKSVLANAGKITTIDSTLKSHDQSLADLAKKIKPLESIKLTSEHVDALEKAYVKENIVLKKQIVKLEEYSCDAIFCSMALQKKKMKSVKKLYRQY